MPSPTVLIHVTRAKSGGNFREFEWVYTNNGAFMCHRRREREKLMAGFLNLVGEKTHAPWIYRTERFLSNRYRILPSLLCGKRVLRPTVGVIKKNVGRWNVDFIEIHWRFSENQATELNVWNQSSEDESFRGCTAKDSGREKSVECIHTGGFSWEYSKR